MENQISKNSQTGMAIPTSKADISLGIFANVANFDFAARMAGALADSTIIPNDYRKNPSNTLIALDMAIRMNCSPMQVMQNLYIVNGRPAWSSQYIIAMINASGKYKTELQFELTGKGESLACYAWAEDHNGHRINGPTITMEMANAEGWTSRNGSKWKTMPEVMIRYRAASFFGRMYCANMIMGIYSQDEVLEGEIRETSVVIDAVKNSEPLVFDDEPAPQEPEQSDSGLDF